MSPMPAQKPGRSKQDYATPKEFLAAVRNYLDIADFDVDLAASFENRVTARYFDEATDSLADGVSWKVGDGWNWLNPPFADIRPWVQKAWLSSAQTAVLIPAGVGANWWRDWVHDKAHVLLLNGRLSFDGIAPYPKDCALLLYSPDLGNGNLLGPGYSVWTWRDDVPKVEAA